MSWECVKQNISSHKWQYVTFAENILENAKIRMVLECAFHHCSLCRTWVHWWLTTVMLGVCLCNFDFSWLSTRSFHQRASGPIFCLLLGVSSDYAQPITGLTLSKRQKTGPGLHLSWSNMKRMLRFQLQIVQVWWIGWGFHVILCEC